MPPPSLQLHNNPQEDLRDIFGYTDDVFDSDSEDTCSTCSTIYSVGEISYISDVEDTDDQNNAMIQNKQVYIHSKLSVLFHNKQVDGDLSSGQVDGHLSHGQVDGHLSSEQVDGHLSNGQVDDNISNIQAYMFPSVIAS